MAIDTQPGTRAPEGSAAATARAANRPLSPDASSNGGWWKGMAIAVGVLAAIGAGASFMIGAAGSREPTPKLTHTITHGDLVVSVTEVGSLESSSNKELKCKVKGGSTVLWVIEGGTEVAPGEVLLRLDASTIEDNINQQEIAYQNAVATHAQSESDVAVAEINVTEYIEGTFRSELKTKQMDVAVAKGNLRSMENVLAHSRRMFRKGYVSALEVESNEFSLQQAKLQLEVAETDLDVLNQFTKAKQLLDLRGIVTAKTAKLASDKAALDLEKARLDRHKTMLENCTLRAEVSGMVIYPPSAAWRGVPDIEEGATVREDQILLMMPDLNKMQVKVGIHEAKVQRLKPGMRARVELQDRAVDGEVLSIAPLATPAGWWTGNMVMYDTIIRLEPQSGLKPGMSATVEVFLAEHQDVLAIPVAAVVEREDGFCCWVKSGEGTQRRSLQLGDSDDQFIVVTGGVKEGDEVVLNPLAYIDEAQVEALKPIRGDNSARENPAKPAADSIIGE